MNLGRRCMFLKYFPSLQEPSSGESNEEMTNTMTSSVHLYKYKPSLNKTNFELNGHILKCLLHISHKPLPLPLVKFFSSVNFHPSLSPFYFQYKCIQLVICYFVIHSRKMASVGAENTSEIY